MSVELEPSELGFRRPFTSEVMQVLHLKNPNHQPVAFKVKTTAPKQYCVRPNSGRIDAGGKIEVQVLLQAMKEDPPLDARCRDKFLVQSAAITADQDNGNISSIWSRVEESSKGSIKERKIRVNFLPPQDPSYDSQPSGVNGASVPDDAPPAYRSPSPAYGSPTPSNAAPVQNADTPSKEGRDEATGASVLGNMSSSISAATSSAGQTVQQQLDAAKETIAKLKGQLEEQGVLRQRKGEGDSRGAGASGVDLQTQPAEGVPVQIVAALCLLSFLLAYFFF